MSLFEAQGRWLFLWPHPDDEISLAGWLHRLAQSRAPVRLVWTHATPVREVESREVMARLGLKDLHFLDAPDGDLLGHRSRVEALLRPLVQGFDHVVTTAYEQGHLDHDALNRLANRLAPGRVLEAPLYHAYDRRLQRPNRFAGEGGSEILCLTPEEVAFKRSLLSAYPSQRLGPILRAHERWHRLLGQGDPFACERLRRQTWTDWTRPNHERRRAARIIRTARWRRWIEAVD